MLSVEEINKLQKENEELKDELNELIISNNRLDYVVNNYHICFDGALGAIQHLAKENLSNPKTVKHYINIALNYLSYRYNEGGEVPNKYKQALDEIEEYIYNNTDFDINDSIQSKTAGYDILQIIKDV